MAQSPITNPQSPLPTLYTGWHDYQALIIKAIEPLTPEQLALKAAPRLRSIGQIASHIIGARARWFHLLMGEGDKEFAAFGSWDRRGKRPRTASELVHGLTGTWQVMLAAFERWTPADLQHSYPGEPPEEPETITRAWVIWHLIEHDLHHGGEISLTLGMHSLPAPNL
jgi:uncharacterized damage-inducible protein DinB